MIDLLDLPEASHRELGRAPGEAWGAAAAELAAIRFELACGRMGQPSKAAMVALAEAHLPLLERFDRGLHDELTGFAEASRLAPWQLVILNHYTDFRDIPVEAGGCSTLYAPLVTGPVAAQTWDMHASAAPYVRLLRLTPPNGAPRVVLFTLAGCQGMTGLNADGVAVCINNLTPDDARVGVLWPSVVRRMLRERSAEAALGVLRGATLGSGHNYLIADSSHVFNVETTATRLAATHEDPKRPYFHTNHYLDPELTRHERPAAAGSTSKERFALLGRLSAPQSIADVEWLLGSHEGICAHGAGDDPAASATCGGMICEVESRRVHASAGCLYRAEWRTVDA